MTLQSVASSWCFIWILVSFLTFRVQDYGTPISYSMLCLCLCALYRRIGTLVLGFCVKLIVFMYAVSVSRSHVSCPHTAIHLVTRIHQCRNLIDWRTIGQNHPVSTAESNLQYKGPQRIPLQPARCPTPAHTHQAVPRNNRESF